MNERVREHTSSRFSLVEQPKRIIPHDEELGFKVDSSNKRLAAEILKNSSNIIETTALGNQLHKYGNCFILVDSHRVRVLYYLQWKNEYFKLLGTTVAQEVLHWRDRGVFESRNLTSSVFFDYLLPIHNAIMTDFQHTADGEKFWLRMIDEAFDRQLYVYAVNFLQTDSMTNNEVKLLNSKLDFNSLLISKDSLNSPWGDENKFMARRIVISNKIL